MRLSCFYVEKGLRHIICYCCSSTHTSTQNYWLWPAVGKGFSKLGMSLLFCPALNVWFVIGFSFMFTCFPSSYWSSLSNHFRPSGRSDHAFFLIIITEQRPLSETGTKYSMTVKRVKELRAKRKTWSNEGGESLLPSNIREMMFGA